MYSDGVNTHVKAKERRFENGKIEAGYHYRTGMETEDYFLETYDYNMGDWAIDDRYTKATSFDRSIHAIYGIFNNEWRSFQYQLGHPRYDVGLGDCLAITNGQGPVFICLRLQLFWYKPVPPHQAHCPHQSLYPFAVDLIAHSPKVVSPRTAAPAGGFQILLID